MRTLTLAASLFFLGGCTGADTPAPPPSEAEFTAMVLDNYIEPFKAGDTDRWMAVFADDVVALHNRREPDVGKPAIRAFGELVAEHFRIEEMDVNVDEVRRATDWVYTRGTYTSLFVDKTSGQPAPWGRETGKFLLVWERQPDNQWKIIVDMGNSNGPVADP